MGTLHLATGFIALAAFWVPLFLKKGAKAHRAFGWVFVGAMAVILGSAATMTLSTVIFDGANRNAALFLGFLTLITFSAVWTGVRVLRHKNEPQWLRSRGQLFMLVVIGAAGVGLLWQWWETRFALFFVFGLVGLIIAIPELLALRKPLKVEPRFWWFTHMQNMIVSGMAAHIAFFAFGASRLWPDLYTGQPWWVMLIPWVAPFPIAFAAIALIQRHYRRKFRVAAAAQ
ncbi:MAG: hypothetical protein ABR565_01745 [Gammaproteobacteria bacterium]